MQRSWFVANELIFKVHQERRTGRLKIVVDNARRGDDDFLSAVAQVIKIWTEKRGGG